MGSKKRSAWQKQKAEFAASLGGLDDLFARETAARDEAREAAHRKKSCERKNRYASRYEAEATAAECAEHGAPPLHVYRCPYCEGWHLTSKEK
ncbi:hypothetical protein [Adlercreutzia mucosicola]|jgi:hypothetical protein|uniref:Uncharacterized protein n=1 Tax=Adlercreutzia mucosicola TaxID=580026 RepID=A0A6N8JJZ4_9ACTN|nr:hypothetical protein [Adlercreutzia mucosicola]MCI9494523.1 hypothetical protein [Adlercreutzia mucosicola]MCR2035088.1 hypothetical protein [Adlercreutzia mucosicola]MEB1813374.1 hypothetical protein [Adlercreutzia mucosicola]MVX60193.1 hypothetical protein [Adlercreutzia mucosicola]